APLDLLAVRRAVVVQRVAGGRESSLEPALVQYEAVRIRDLDDVEGRVERPPEPLVLAPQTAEELERERPDGLVRMGDAEQQRRPGPVSDGEQLDRPTLARRPHRLESRDAGMLGDERPRARAELVQGEEFAEVRYPREQRRGVDHTLRQLLR